MGKNMGLVWKSLKNWFGWRKQGSPSQLFHDGHMYTKPKDLARIMNEYFINKVRNHVTSLAPPISCPIEPIRKMMQNKTCSLDLAPVHPDQVDKIISGLKTNSSCGIDNIDVKILKIGYYRFSPT